MDTSFPWFLLNPILIFKHPNIHMTFICHRLTHGTKSLLMLEEMFMRTGWLNLEPLR